MRKALAVAWSRRGPLVAWATVSTIIGLLLELLERIGAAGTIVRFLAGLTWAVATVFTVPILIAEGTGPIETARRSAGIVRDKLGTLIRSNVRLAMPWIVAMVAAGFFTAAGVCAFVIGINGGKPINVVFGGTLMLAGGVAFFFCSATSSALSTYVDTLLYRYATGQPLPDIDPRHLPPILAA